jgi:hypothetical protein
MSGRAELPKGLRKWCQEACTSEFVGTNGAKGMQGKAVAHMASQGIPVWNFGRARVQARDLEEQGSLALIFALLQNTLPRHAPLFSRGTPKSGRKIDFLIITPTTI